MALASCPGYNTNFVFAPRLITGRQAKKQKIYWRDRQLTQLIPKVRTVIFTDVNVLCEPAELGDIVPVVGVSKQKLLGVLRVLTQAAAHPLAHICAQIDGLKLASQPIVEVFEKEAEGIRGKIDHEPAEVGTTAFIKRPLSDWAALKVKQLTHLRQVPFLVVQKGRLLGIAGVKYRLNPEATSTMVYLRTMGVSQLALASSGAVAEMTAQRLGLAYFSSPGQAQAALPEIMVISSLGGRADAGKEILALAGLKVLFTGPVSKENDQVCPEGNYGADIVIHGGELSKLKELFSFAWRIENKIQENTALFNLKNQIGLFLGAFGWLSPLNALLYYQLTTLVLGINSCLGWSGKKPGSKTPGEKRGGPANPGNKPGLTLVKASPEAENLPEKNSPALNRSNETLSPSFNGHQWTSLPVEEVLARLKTDLKNGLSAVESNKRLSLYGLNQLPEVKKPGLILQFGEQLKNIMLQTLMGAAAICLFLGQRNDALTIGAIVFINTVFGVVQERKAENTLAALRQLTSPTARVRREGQIAQIPAAQLVPGDIITLQPGDKVPADARLLSLSNLEIDEAILTGESLPRRKKAAPQENCLVLYDCHNMCFTGTTVTRGKAVAAVVATGLSTEIGQIARLMQNENKSETPLQHKLTSISQGVLWGCLAASGMFIAAGLARGEKPWQMLFTSVSLAVAAIPEGLPATVTLALAAGVQRMAGQNAVVRQLAGVETLGCATVICSDKTGTLTKNKQTVKTVYRAEKFYPLSPGENILTKGVTSPAEEADLLSLLKAGVLCNDARLNFAEGKYKIIGDPLEGALLKLAGDANINPQELQRRHLRVAEIPFDAERKRMTVICQEQGAYFAYCKGAPEKILSRSTKYQKEGEVLPLDAQAKAKIEEACEKLTQQALRVLAFAYRKDRSPALKEEQENDLIFLGLVGLHDPLRTEVKKAVALCRKAGIKVVMLTGDHPNTACAVGKELGLVQEDRRVFCGRELEKSSEAELNKMVKDTNIFARVSPRHKLKIVQALQRQGNIVVMVGDGVNDAPAVKRANIGVCMGRNGPDVTREASTIVITDDNFATIVKAVEEGRGTYENIRKSVRYQLATNSGEIILMLSSVMLGLPLPLVPLQLLWLNILGDGLPALALCLDPPAKDVMALPPRPVKSKFFDSIYTRKILRRGITIGATSLGSYIYTLNTGKNTSHARTVALSTITLSQMLHALDCRWERKAAAWSGIPNKYLLAAVGSSCALLLGTLYLPGMRLLFQTWPLNLKDWLVIMAGSGLSAGLDYLTGLLGPPDQEKTGLKPELPGPLPATGKLN
jgi:Ca2+-transporting ATPase